MPQTYSLSFGPDWMRPKNSRSFSESNSAKPDDAQNNANPEDATSDDLHSSIGGIGSQLPRRKNPKSPWTSSKGEESFGRGASESTKGFSSSNGVRSYRNISSSDPSRPARGSPFTSWSSAASASRNMHSKRSDTKPPGDGMTDHAGFHGSSVSEHTSAETEANKKLISSLLQEPQPPSVPVQPYGRQYSPEEMLQIWSALHEAGDIDRYIPASLTSDDSASSALSSQSSHFSDPPDTEGSEPLGSMPAQLFRRIKSNVAQSPVLFNEPTTSMEDDEIIPPDHIASTSLAFINSPQQTKSAASHSLSNLDSQDPFDPSFRAASRTQDPPLRTASSSHHPFTSGLGRLDTQSPSLSSPWATSPFGDPKEMRGTVGSDLFQQPSFFGSGSRPLSRSTSQGPELFNVGLGPSSQPFASDAPIASPGIHQSRILPSSISRTATPLQQNQSQQPPPGLNHPSLKTSIADLLVGPERLSWIYKDSSGNEQGPFNGQMMHEWYVNNWLQEDLPIRREEQEDFIPLGTFKLQVGNSSNPFLVPLPPITRSLAAGGNGVYSGLAPGSPMSAGFASMRTELQSQVSASIPVETIADAWNTVLGRSNTEIEQQQQQQQQQQEAHSTLPSGQAFQRKPELESWSETEPQQKSQETNVATSFTHEVEEKLDELQIDESAQVEEAALEQESPPQNQVEEKANGHSVWDDITPKKEEVEEDNGYEKTDEQDNLDDSAWGEIATSTSTATPASVAPWAEQASMNKKVPSLKDIQEREAAAREKAKKANKFPSGGMESRIEPRSAANVVSAALFLGQKQSTSSPSSSLPNTAPWARPNTTPASAPRKTLEQIQKEEEEKRKARAQTASSAASNSVSAASIASRLPGSSTARMTSTNSSSSPWVTVTSKKSSGTAVNVGTPSSVPGAATVKATARPSNGNVRSVSTTRVIPSGATLQPSASKDEFLKWCNSSIKDLRSSIKKQDLISMFLSLPLESRESSEIVSEAIYASSTTMDGRRFASEFMKKRAAVEGSGRAPSSATAGTDQTSSKGGWSDVLARQPEPVNDGWNPVVKVVGKKKSRKTTGGES